MKVSTVPAKVNPNLLPAAFAPYLNQAGNKEITDGVVSGFAVISYRGKVWRVRKGGEEQNYLNDEGEAMPSIELVLVRSNSQPSKTFFDKQYEEGSNEPPRCWSSDGFKPDAEVINPINPVCASCRNNAWGSKVTDQGKKGRACADVRRMAVVFLHELEEKGKDATLLLLRVPPASLNPLKDFAVKVLEPRGLQYFMIATRVGFDPQVAHPKFTFKAKRPLNNDEATAIVALRESEDARRILAEAAEFDTDGITGSNEVTGAGATAPVEATPTPSASGPSAVSQEVFPDSEEEDDEGEAEEVAPPPPPARKKRAAKAANGHAGAAAPAPKKSAAPVVAPPPAPAAEDDDFESMLDSILKPVKG